MEQLIIVVIVGLTSSLITFLIVKKINNANFNIYIEQAKAKAKVIEHEAQSILKDAKIKAKIQLEQVTHDNEDIANLKNSLKQKIQKYEQKLQKILKILENASGLTKNEAKDLLLEQIKDESRALISSIFRKEYKLAQQNMKTEVNNILSQAVTRYAGEFAAERLTNNIVLKDEETKGKIIGKDGRNIKTLEMVTGVDIIIGDIPNAIVISSFNLYRRAVATKTLEELIEDGRIQPARIEEVYSRVKNEFDKNIIKEGEDTVVELGIKNMHPELIKLVGKLRYRASYGQNALAHTLEVANLAGLIASQLGGDTIMARRAGLMHDIGKALTHDVKGSHVDIGASVCKKFGEPEIVINAIYAHHEQEEPTSIESAAVCAADALSAARPGARREVLQNFLKRVEEIEAISTSKAGVVNAYAINAGREIRVIVNASLVNDDESILLATEIAQDIEDKVQYPGEIKVNVIREIRATGYAR
jgi:ribonuclease Y